MMKRIQIVALAVLLLAGCSGGQAPQAGGKPVRYWIEALKDNDPKLRKTAVFKLGNVGPTDAAVLPALLEALRDHDARVRCETILAILKFGPEAKEAIPALDQTQRQDRDAKVRTFAAKALTKLRQEN
jgi:HEAT repeat protein